MSTTYELEKKVWTESDFAIMGWHDSSIYGMVLFSDASSSTTELAFDIDYIFKWIDPVAPNLHFSFWIAPATLVFKNVYNLKIEINQNPPNTFDLEIADIHRLEESTYAYGLKFWHWHIELQNGNIYFESGGYEQFIKKPPELTGGQRFPVELRGKQNFDRITF